MALAVHINPFELITPRKPQQKPKIDYENGQQTKVDVAAVKGILAVMSNDGHLIVQEVTTA